MDALIPFIRTFSDTMDFGKAVEQAATGADSTRHLDAVLGRASYVGKGIAESVPDPGAVGVVSILRGIEQALKG
jgi:dihydroxyacetone kinase